MNKHLYRTRTRKERALEIMPAALTWLTFAGAVVLSLTHPAWAAAYIIVFDVYWVLKAINTTFHLLSAYNHYRYDLTVDWLKELELVKNKESYLQNLREALKNTKNRWRHAVEDRIERVEKHYKGADYRHLYHVLIFPFVDESIEILRSSISAAAKSNYPKDRVVIMLAVEQRVGPMAELIARELKSEFAGVFRDFLISVHPDGLPGEIRGKSANVSYAVEHALVPWAREQGIDPANVVISNLDSDTVVHKDYLARVSFEWVIAKNPHRQSYQPIALYNNNMWDSPALVRVIAVANSFWQFMESSRPDRLRTFSSHSMSLKTLIEVGYYKKDVVNEDSCIFWQCYFHFNGNYKVQPVFIPVSMDTCLAPTYLQTLVNQYKQKRRWAYNVEYFPWFSKNLLSNTKISVYNRLYKFWQYVEGNYNWATASIIIASMGFLPSILGDKFANTVFGFNLPLATRLLMNIALVFLIFSVYINMVLLPPRPSRYKWTRTAAMYAQWALVPFISIIWGSVPAIEAQTRVALGRYMEFWVTPKARPITENKPAPARPVQITTV